MATLAALGGGRAAAAPALGSLPGATGPEATTLSYDVDASMLYTDALTRGAAGDLIPASTPPAEAGATRTLGLRQVSLGLRWQAARSCSLHLVLRPDAASRPPGPDGVVREIDTRSGDAELLDPDPKVAPNGRHLTPSVQLLDTYELELHPSPALSGAVGVFANLAPAAGAYPEILAFGLAPLMPEKTLGVALGWTRRSAALDTDGAAGAGAPVASFSVRATAFQGNDERGEAQAGRDATGDLAPAAREPYTGAALALEWQPEPRFTLDLLGGSYREQVDLSAAQDASLLALRDEVFTDLAATTNLRLGTREAKVALDLRFVKDSWHADAEALADTSMLSGELTASVPVREGLWGLLGTGWGRTQRWKEPRSETADLTGYQLEAGVLWSWAQNLFFEALATNEYRTLQTDTGHVGGFQNPLDPNSPRQALVRRLGLELTYRLGA